jgi:prepilin-type N-terminal cleavage/methylation domain-containing protein
MQTTSERGFSLIELLVSTLILLVIMGTVMTALRQQTQQQQTIWNRTQMHSGVRGATELMQQEIGQAGRVATPVPITMNNGAPNVKAVFGAGAVCDPANPATNASTIQVNSVAGLWAAGGASTTITTLDGPNRENVPISAFNAAVNPPTVSACFVNAHAPGTTMDVEGGFGSGIILPQSPTNPNGSTATVLKMFGDINGDGNMVYVEYTCDTVNNFKLYRNSMPFDAVAKPPLGAALVMLNNIQPNPGNTPCFTYQTVPSLTIQGQQVGFVLDVAITLTIQTQQRDPVTKQFQQETKALLNVSPRNVFNAWDLGQWSYPERIQSTPATVAALTGM